MFSKRYSAVGTVTALGRQGSFGSIAVVVGEDVMGCQLIGEGRLGSCQQWDWAGVLVTG